MPLRERECVCVLGLQTWRTTCHFRKDGLFCRLLRQEDNDLPTVDTDPHFKGGEVETRR